MRPWHHYLRQVLFLPVLATAWFAPYRLQRWLARATAWFIYHLAPPLRRRMHKNLSRVLPEASHDERKAKAIAVLTHYGCYVLDFFALLRGRGPQLLRRDAGPDPLLRVLKPDRGVILATAHIGSWEIAAVGLAQYGADVAVVSAAEEIGYLGALRTLIRRRQNHQEVLLEHGPHAMIDLLGRLRSGGLVGLQIDRIGRAGHFSVPFFGARLRMPRGPAKLSVMSGAAILPVFAVFNEEGTYDVITEDPILPGDSSEEEVTRQLGAILEKYVRQYPEQWLMLQDPWDDEPPSETQPSTPRATPELAS